MLRFFDRRIGAVALALLMPMALLVSTATGADREVNAADLFGEKPAALDPQKSRLPFSELTPPVAIESSASVEDKALPDRAKRAVDRAASLRKERRYTEALIELEKALRLAPADRRVLRAMALTSWEAGDQRRARRHIKEALAISEDDVTCHYILGRLAASRFENETAILEFRKATACSVDEDTDVFKVLAELDLGETLLVSGYQTAAIDQYQRVGQIAKRLVADDKRYTLLFQKLDRLENTAAEQIAKAYSQLGEYGQAVEILQKEYGDSDPSAQRRLEYAKLLARAGEFDEAIAEARKALGTHPEAIDVLAAIYAHQNRPEAIIDEFASTTEGDTEAPKITIARASALARFGRHEEAANVIGALVKSHPHNIEVVRTAVEIFIAAKNWLRAVDAMALAVRGKAELAPDIVRLVGEVSDGEVGMNLLDAGKSSDFDYARAFVFAHVASALGKNDAAKDWFERAVDDRPEFVPSRIGLARIYLDQWKWEEAIEVAAPDQPVLERDTRLEVILGEAYRGLDEMGEAISHYESAVRLHRANTGAMLALAELYSAKGNRAASRRQLEKILQIDAFNDKARSRLCLNHIDSGDRRAAAEQIQKLRLHRAPLTVVAQCVAALEFDPQSPDHARFRQTLQEAVAATKADADTLQLVGMSYMQQMNWAEAIKAFEAALEIDPKHSESSTLLLECRQKNLQFQEALELQRELLLRHPHRRPWKNNLLDLLLTLQQYDDAIETAQKLIDEPGVEPTQASRYRAEIVEVHLLRKQYAIAIKIMEAWRTKEKDNLPILRALISACQTSKNHERALELIRQWGADIPGGFASGGAERIWMDLLPEQRGEVTELLLEAIAIDPQNDQLYISLIELLRASGKNDEALAIAQNSAVDGSFKDLYMHEMQITLESAGRIDEAIEVVEEMMAGSAEAAAKNPGMHAFLRQTLAQLLINNGRTAQAVEKLTRWHAQAKAVGDKEQEVLFLGLLSIAHQESGNRAEAREALNLSLKLDPANVGLHNDLGYTLADAGVELERAERLIRVAVGEYPRIGAYLDSLGWVLYKKGDYSEARRWLELARGSRDGEDPVVCDHLGDVCWRLGDRDNATQWWRDGIEIARERMASPPIRNADRQAAESMEKKLAAVDEGKDPVPAPVVESTD